MNNYFKALICILLLSSPIMIKAQIFTDYVCHSFDSNMDQMHIDTSSIWAIGNPNKTYFNDSFEGINSIITGLDSSYANNDTSVFLVEFPVMQPWGGFLPFEVSFMHRFDTESPNDYGKVEVSFDTGVTWFDLASDTLSAPKWNYWVSAVTNDTVYGTKPISGNSNGWVYSRFKKSVNNGLFGIDYNFLIRFTWITDGAGVGEGWQIDNLCFTLDYITSIDDMSMAKSHRVYPNPTSSVIHFDLDPVHFNEPLELYMFDVTGRIVLTQTINPNENTINVTHLKPGFYSYRLNETWGNLVIQ